MVKRVKSFILFTLGLLLGALIYWFTSVSFFSKVEDSYYSSRIIASFVNDRLRNCDQLNTITDKNNIDIYCSFVTQKTDRGVRYKVRSTVTIRTDQKSKKAVISVKKKLKDKSEHITEADYCGDDCVEPMIVDFGDVTDLKEVSQVLKNQISNLLNKEEENIEDAVDDAYDVYNTKKKIKRRVNNCEISSDSKVGDIVKITANEKIKCRRDQLADIEESKERTDFFHSTVKEDLWYLAQQDEPLDHSFFLSDYMKEINSPHFFDYDYLSVHSSIDTIKKYNDLRLFMHELGTDKIAALNAITAQMPMYFYTNGMVDTGRRDRELLEAAWNKNFQYRPFPAYYSLTVKPRRVPDKPVDKREGLSAQQFKAIINSPTFQKLYRQ